MIFVQLLTINPCCLDPPECRAADAGVGRSRVYNITRARPVYYKILSIRLQCHMMSYSTLRLIKWCSDETAIYIITIFTHKSRRQIARVAYTGAGGGAALVAGGGHNKLVLRSGIYSGSQEAWCGQAARNSSSCSAQP